MAPRRKTRRKPKPRRKAKAQDTTVHNGSVYFTLTLVLLAGFLMIMAVKLSNAPVLRLVDLLPVGVMITASLATWLLFRTVDFKGDHLIAPLMLFLSGLGLLIQLRLGILDFTDPSRASSYAYPLGILCFVITWGVFRRGRYELLSGLALPCLIAACGLLAVILLFGDRYRGAVFLAGQVNPAELLKLLLVIFLAGVMTDFKKHLQQTVAGIPAPPMSSVVTLAVLWAVPMALLVAQRDLGMIILLNIVLLVLIFMATGRWGYLVLGSIAGVAVSFAGFQLFAHARMRFLAWQDPFADPTGKGWQILQSLSAMFSGGLWGSGLGSGAPTTVPIAASDFVYAAYAEELGFIGCVLLVIVYLLLFYRGFKISDQLRKTFPQTLAAGLTTMLAVQTLMNIGGVTKAIPLTGITLPLISHGGSSLITSMIMLGLLAALSEPAARR